MDNMTAILWLATIKQANEGDKEQQEVLRQENELRAENGLPTVQEELMEMAK